MAGKTVVILGGGVGGIIAARRLSKSLGREHRIVLVEANPAHVFAPSFLWLMVGMRRPEQIARPLASLIPARVEIINGTVEHIDPAARTVRVDGRELKANHLIVALGSELCPETIPGLVESGHNFYTLDGAQSLRDARLRTRSGRLVVLVASMPFKCPAAPYEAAMLVEADLRKRRLRDAFTIDVFSPEPGPMAVAGPDVSAQVRGMVEAKDITYHPEHAVTEIDPATRRISFSNGAAAEFDLLAYVPPHRAPEVVRDSGLCGENGWVAVDMATLATRFEDVYAIGDVTGIGLKLGKPLPKAGVFAHGEAETVAANIAAQISGRPATKTFDGHGECFLETGDGKAGMGSGNFYAEPTPQIGLRNPSHLLHFGKVAFEKLWLAGMV